MRYFTYKLALVNENRFASSVRHVYLGSADGGVTIGNSGLVELSGQIVVFDTYMTPQTVADLRRASEELFRRLPDLVFIRRMKIRSRERKAKLLTFEGVQMCVTWRNNINVVFAVNGTL